MTAAAAEPRLLLVTGLSGAGKSTALKVLEDLGWEVVDNLPLALLDALIEAPAKRSEANRPMYQCGCVSFGLLGLVTFLPQRWPRSVIARSTRRRANASPISP